MKTNLRKEFVGKLKLIKIAFTRLNLIELIKIGFD